MSYNLDDNIAESFEFILGGHTYRMQYPTSEEITKLATLEEGSQDQIDWVYSFITPTTEGAPSIKDVLEKVNIKKAQAFQTMIKTEFASE